MGENGAFLQCHLKQVFWKVMPGKSYISLLLNNPNTWGKSLQFWKQQVGKEKITQREGERKQQFLGSSQGSFPQLCPKWCSAFLCLGLLASFPFDPLEFPVFIPHLFASFLFSPCDWISYMTQWPQSLPRTEPTFQETLPRSQWREDDREGRGTEWEDGKLEQLTKIKELKQITVHKNRQCQLYPIHI